MATYRIDYILYDSVNKPVKSGTYDCKNKNSKFEAFAGLENHLLKKHPEAKYMKVRNCYIETMLGFINEDNPFQTIFGK